MQQGYPRWRGFAIGFASGALSSLGGSAFMMYGGDVSKSIWGVTGFSAFSGGISAELTGGEFWKGAATGAIVGLLNHGHEQVNQATLQKQLDSKLQSIEVGETISGKDLASVLGNDKISMGVSKITRVSETNFEIIRTNAAAISGLIKKDASMMITTTTLKINNVSESVFRIQINGLSKTVIGWGVPTDSYLLNNRLYFYENGKLYYY